MTPPRLTPYTPTYRTAITQMAVQPDQIRFSGTPAEALAHATKDPDIDLHLIVAGDTPVGLFKIDRAYHRRYPFATQTDLGLRAFLIDTAHQGRGLATAATSALPTYLSAHYPQAKALVLTVNHANPAARRAYLNGGFTDTGTDWPHGDAGPQDILRLPL